MNYLRVVQVLVRIPGFDQISLQINTLQSSGGKSPHARLHSLA